MWYGAAARVRIFREMRSGGIVSSSTTASNWEDSNATGNNGRGGLAKARPLMRVTLGATATGRVCSRCLPSRGISHNVQFREEYLPSGQVRDDYLPIGKLREDYLPDEQLLDVYLSDVQHLSEYRHDALR